MELIKIFLSKLIKDSTYEDKFYIRNILKNYLQILVLDFIYTHKEYNQLLFYGGSCLAHCYNLPRLSEDLDFVDLRKRIEVSKLAKDLGTYFNNDTDIGVKIVTQKFRVYLKFPILRELGISGKNESDLLFLKVEIYNEFDFCTDFKVETIPLFKYNKTLLIKTFDLPTLMATKIRAVLMRKWEKTDKSGEILATVKGRDYYDLLWYLEKGIQPNFRCIEGINDKEELKKKLLSTIEKVDVRSIQFDLEALIGNYELVKKLSNNMKEILKRMILNM
ncbi:MAG: nucleotidyl transferase AbiEii/AbiGii toxin family protein [Atribacterota bacterium]|jgi:predicted nucleotidyltransferase component of viral defense system|nr:nucleotidyl transferase AbiEii/AbiGii toxin family protein [Atribacterota bacterium]